MGGPSYDHDPVGSYAQKVRIARLETRAGRALRSSVILFFQQFELDL
jgi:hypothetical protein